MSEIIDIEITFRIISYVSIGIDDDYDEKDSLKN